MGNRIAGFVLPLCNGTLTGFSGRLRLPVNEFDPNRGRAKGVAIMPAFGGKPDSE
jgi:hypothetical protein